VSKAAIQRSNGGFTISGELTFATVTALLEQSRALFSQADEAVEVDLGAVERVDSASSGCAWPGRRGWTSASPTCRSR
jgi:ABC-type transporter Mla MlaB component